MQKISVIPIITILLLGLFACDEDEITPVMLGFEYPMQIGNTLEYLRTTTKYLHPDSTTTTVTYVDTIYEDSSRYKVSITRELNFGDTLNVIEMTNVLMENPPGRIPRSFYEVTEDGLFIVGYTGGTMVLPKANFEKSVYFKDMRFNNMFELLEKLQHPQLFTRSTVSDSIHYESPKVKTLQYPLQVGEQWVYRDNHNPWRMDRKVIGRSVLSLEVGNFDCLEIKFIYDMDHDGEWDEDIWITDYISPQGLIQRVIHVLHLEDMNSMGIPDGKYFDLVFEQTLESFDLVQE